MSTASGRVRQWSLWSALLLVVAGMLLLLRGRLDKAHVALAFLLVVLGGSAAGGRALGLALAFGAFVLFDVGFLPPYYTFRVDDPFDWIVLVAFLVTGAVGAELLERQRSEAEIARARTSELDRLATLGAETLNAPRPEDALHAIADVIRQLMGTDRCDISVGAGPDGEAAPAGPEAPDSRRTMPARERRIPLLVRERTVGTLTLESARPFLLSRDQERILGALSYYAALGAERVRLSGAELEADQLRRADRVKDALLASVSHDLRTPLTTIKGIANEIARGGDASSAWVIEEEADRLTAIVTDLLDLSQLAAGQMPVTTSLNTADDVIGAALQRVEAAFPERRFEATLTEPWTELVGQFDFVHTMRILTNLLENAARYAPADSVVRLVASRSGAALHFAVEDAGPGIASADVDRMFEPFVRGAAPATGARGTGLGLTIARQLAAVQGGTLAYERPGAIGNRFVLAVRAAEPRGEGMGVELA